MASKALFFFGCVPAYSKVSQVFGIHSQKFYLQYESGTLYAKPNKEFIEALLFYFFLLCYSTTKEITFLTIML
jgi:hypothetical protein